jgi:hypothetical protein
VADHVTGQARILVYCDERPHEPKVADVAQLVRDDDASPWQAMPTRWRSASQRRADAAETPGAPDPTGGDPPVLRGKLYEETALTQLVPSGDGIPDWKYNLRCPLCGLHLERRAELAKPRLDRLADAGVSRVSLRHLMRVLLK